MAQNLNNLSIPLNGTGTEIPTLNITDNYAEYWISGTVIATGNYGIVPTGTPQNGTTFIFNYIAVVDITTHSKTFSIFGQSLTQNQLLYPLLIKCNYNGSSWEVGVYGSLEDQIIEAINIVDGAVGSTELADLSVTDNKYANLSIATGKVKALAITDPKINDVNGSKLVAASVVGSAKLTDTTVTFVKLQNVTSDRLLGRDTAGSGVTEELTVGGGLAFTGSTGIMIDTGGVSNVKLATMPTMTVKANVTGGTASPTDVTITSLQTLLFGEFTAGAGVNSITRTDYTGTASGTGSLNLGDTATVASGILSTAGGSSSTASGDYSTAFGSTVTASGVQSTAFGVLTIASGIEATAFGSANTASGNNSTAFGKTTTASGRYSTSLGILSIADKRGQVAMSSGRINSTGYAQKSELFLGNITTGATPTNLYLDMDGSTQIPTIASGVAVRFKGTIVAVQSSAPSGIQGDMATFDFYGTIKNIAGTTALVGSVLFMNSTGTISSAVAQSSSNSSATTWTVSITSDDTNDALSIVVTGQGNKTIYWHCVMEWNEIKYT